MVVTGTSQGIGAATAKRLAVEGATVEVVDRGAPDTALDHCARTRSPRADAIKRTNSTHIIPN
ncbi:SDR family NAD(P)-dependent oxidoreductase [Nocardia arthritidis]|uniref:SDR family NAD(P)-dependent oxidoreductase n=1 Tax=Nocardia arthritidis TaxID=228602 RepID=A0A6G9YAH8_9NOCA|nr:SDR family NAD(P)-dependent oxidoreductase [Nocardia arthritidis]QIS10168.1 SDR family NAD(P)-dependent oxidoreductase [Nocardia arthritidis]